MATITTQAVSSVSREFYDRRHPAYNDLLEQWKFVYASYKGGRAWFNTNIFRYLKEGDKEFADRVERAYRFNHTREVVDLVQKYLFKAPIGRRTEDVSETLKSFWAASTRSGLSIDQFMKNASTYASLGGRVAVVIDNNERPVETEDGAARRMSVAEREAAGVKIYAYTVMPWDILDYAWDEDGDGELLWIKLREYVRDDADPFLSSGLIEERVRLWTRERWSLYKEVAITANTRQGRRNVAQEEKQVIEIDSGDHNLGYVPVKLLDHTLSSEPYVSTGMVDDIAYLDRAVANYLSNLDAIIQDQTFSQLAIPASSLSSDENVINKVVEMGTKRIFTYDGGAGSTAKPEYLSPDPKQAHVILAVINKIINEIYHTIGLAGERTKQDNAVGIDNSSGVAKAYDFERVNSLLLAKAGACEHLENWIVKTVYAWAGEDVPPDQDRFVTYPSTFDIARLSDELATAEALNKINAPIEIKRTQMLAIVDKLFPQISAALKAELRAAVTRWESDDPADDADNASDLPSSTSSVAGSRQGEVTSTTQERNQ